MMLLSEPRMSDREKVCARKWLEAAIDNDDPDLADYWKEQGLLARAERVGGGGEEMPEPPFKEYKPRKAAKACEDCGSTTCKNNVCLL